MSALTNLSNSLTNILPKNPIHNLNISSSSISFIKTKDGIGSASLGELTQGVSTALGDIAQLVNTAYCIGKAITNPSMLLNALDMMGGQLLAVAYSVADRIFSVIEGQIEGMFSTVAGTILNVVTSVLSFLQSVLNLIEALVNVYNAIKNMAKKSWDDFMSQEDCEFMLAQMGMCLMNKLFGDKLQTFEDKVTKQIVETGQSLNSALTDRLTDTNDTANFIRHESFMVNKASAQINMVAGVI